MMATVPSGVKIYELHNEFPIFRYKRTDAVAIALLIIMNGGIQFPDGSFQRHDAIKRASPLLKELFRPHQQEGGQRDFKIAYLAVGQFELNSLGCHRLPVDNPVSLSVPQSFLQNRGYTISLTLGGVASLVRNTDREVLLYSAAQVSAGSWSLLLLVGSLKP